MGKTIITSFLRTFILLFLCTIAPTVQADYQPFPQPLIELKLGRNRSIQHGDSDPFDDVRSFTVTSQNGSELPSYDTVYYFDQLIDHSNPQLGTFGQRYYFTYEFYEPGGPIFFNAPSEANLERFDGSITNSTINGFLAQSNKGAALVLEHRFFGRSNPFPTLSERNLSRLTLNQTLEDIVYFATNVELPMPDGDQVSPDKAPWVLVGGSYAGALVAWTMTKFPGIFAAGWASSAVVETMNYNWIYFDIIRQNMPANCSADLQTVINHVDEVFTSGTTAEQTKIKTMFGLSALKYADEFVSAIRAPLWTWQDFQPSYEDATTGFNAFCNYMEYDRDTKVFEAKGRGMGIDHAMEAYGNWSKFEIRQAGCTGVESVCYGTHDNDDELWTDTRVGLNFRSWAWLYCNEFGWFFSGAPESWPSITSRLTNPDTEFRTCSLYFPDTFPQGTNASTVVNNTAFNNKYGGWDIKTEHVFFVNGKKDPWRGVTLSSDFNNRRSTSKQPILVAEGGFHCSDQVMAQGHADDSVGIVQELGAAYIYRWLSKWYSQNPSVDRPSSVRSWPDPDELPHPIFTVDIIPPSVIDAPPYDTNSSIHLSSPSSAGGPQIAGSTPSFSPPLNIIKFLSLMIFLYAI